MSQRPTAKKNKRKKHSAKRSVNTGRTDVIDHDDVVDDKTDANDETTAAKSDTAKVDVENVETDLEGTPGWTHDVYEANGYLAGVIVFLISVGFMWPLAIVLAASLIVIIGTFFITMLPGVVSSTLGVGPDILLSSADRFVFSWILPVFFISTALAIMAGFAGVSLMKKLARTTSALRRGLYAGHGETWLENRKRRKEEAGARKIAKQMKRAEKKTTRARAQAAEEAMDND